MKPLRFLSVLLCAAGLLLSLTACDVPEGDLSGDMSADSSSSSSGEETASGPFSLAYFPEYSLHPVLAANRANLTLSPLLYEPLFQLDEHFQAVPVLCRSYSVTPDKLTWTFSLHTGVTFSDGTALTGQIVADALELARTEGSRYAQRLRDVVSVAAVEQDVIITLVRPNGRLPQLLDIPIALGLSDRPLGTGPYVLAGTDEEPMLTARSGWWQKKSLPVQELPLRPARKSDELIFAFDTGDLSLVDVDLMGTNTLGYSSNCETWDYPTTSMVYLGFNAQRGLCRSPEIRQALSRAIDRTSVAQNLYADHAEAAALPVHPASPLYDNSMAEHLAYDPKQLTALLEEFHALGREVSLLVNSENGPKLSTAQLIAYQLESAGVPVKLLSLPFDDYAAALAAGNFDLYLGEVVLTADFDLSPLLAPGAPMNYGGWISPPITGLLTSLSAADSQAAPVAARALFKHLEQEVPITAICFKNGSVLTQWGRLSGLNPVRGNVFYQLENWIVQ